MKKVLSLLLALIVLLSFVPVAFAQEYDEDAYQDAIAGRRALAESIRAKRMEERERMLSEATKRPEGEAFEDEAMLFAAPIAFKDDVTITLPISDSVVLEFKTPLTEWPDMGAYLVDSDGNRMDCWVDVYCEGEFNYETYEESYSTVEIGYIDSWGLDEGEYELYVENYIDGKVYGPVTVLNPGYEFYGILRTGKLSYLDYSFNNNIDAIPELVDITLINSDGDIVYTLDSVGIDYGYEYGFSIQVLVPASIANGTYTLETTLYYADGTEKALIPNSIMVGDFAYVSNINIITRRYDESTEEVYVEAYYDSMPINMSEYEIIVCENDGTVVASSSNYSIVGLYNDSVHVIYTVEVDNLTAEEYTVSVRYSGDKELCGRYSDVIYRTDIMSWYSSVEKTKKVSDTEYLALTVGIDAGEYTLYDYDDDSMAVGTFTVASDGTGRIVFDEAYSKSFTCMKYNDNIEYIYLDQYNSYREGMMISSVTPGFIGASAKDIEGFEFALSDYAYFTLEEISEVSLIYDGAVIATGENITDFVRGYSHIGGMRYAETNFGVDFSVSKTLKAGETVTLKVETVYGVSEYEIPVVSSSDTTYMGYWTGVNGFYMGGDKIALDPENPYDYAYCDVRVGEDVEFYISNINRTSFNAELCRYNADEYTFEIVKTLKSSSMTKTQVAGYAYNYTGTFSNLTDGYYFINVEGNTTGYFKVVTDPVIYTYGNCLEYYGENDSYYFETLNVSSSDTIKAYYYNSSGSKKTVTTTSEINEGYAYLTFKLSGISFDNLTLYLTCNGKDVGTLKVYNMEGAEQAGWVNYQCQSDELFVGFNDTSALEKPVLVVKAFDDLCLTRVGGETVLEKPLDFGTANYAVISVSDLGLEDGEYMVYVTDGERIVSYYDEFGVRNTQSAAMADVEIESVTTTTSRVTAKLKNNTESTLKNVYLVVAGYNADGICVGAKTKKVSSISSGSTTSAYVAAISGAETYEVFVWDGVSTMKPLSK